jgi:hypothetical protein
MQKQNLKYFNLVFLRKITAQTSTNAVGDDAKGTKEFNNENLSYELFDIQAKLLVNELITSN